LHRECVRKHRALNKDRVNAAKRVSYFKNRTGEKLAKMQAYTKAWTRKRNEGVNRQA
jgi:hypothetical protein